MWFFTWLSNYLVQVTIKVLQCGSIPKHFAIILDGNRRFAKRHREKTEYGHRKGGEVIKNLVRWIRMIGIKELTLYAFSTENFKRDQKEIEDVFSIIELLLIEAVEQDYDTNIRIVGDVEKIPDRFKKTLSRQILKTVGEKKYTLNLAIAYTSRNEITNAIKLVKEGVQNGHLKLEDVDEDLLTQCLYVRSEPDILVRTSGEVRLSDFLLWQLKRTQIFFVDVLWPNFNVWHLLLCVFKYQANLKNIPLINTSTTTNPKESTRRDSFLEMIKTTQLHTLEKYANS